MRILILCTGNSCRSQMAEGLLQAFDGRLEVSSAGTAPAANVHPKAVLAMQEMGVSLENHFPKHVDIFLHETWDLVITVCGGANENCPVFSGKVKRRIHIGFTDPADASGSDEEIMQVFRQVRNEILCRFFTLYRKDILPSLG